MTESRKQTTDKPVSLREHLEELRSRIIKSLIVVIVCSFVLYNYIDRILKFLTKPVGKLIFIAPQEAFVTNIKIAIWGVYFYLYLLYFIKYGNLFQWD